jgi:hypothetical protein
MTEKQHPITIPPELLSQWIDRQSKEQPTLLDAVEQVANKAGQWCADKELKKCCDWIENQALMPAGARADLINKLRIARRPTIPPSLAEKGLNIVHQLEILGKIVDLEGEETKQQLNILKEALNRLAKLEANQ